MAIPASNIKEVIAELDIIVADCIRKNNKMGLFAALYRKVTIRVQEGIAAGRFENGERMERLDVTFANRYLEAYQAYLNEAPLTSSWLITFNAAKNPRLLILQHLFAGMNSHISLDLGIATAHTAKGETLMTMKRDFDEINKLLSDLIDDVQKAMEKASIMMIALDWLGGNKDEKLARFSLELFRKRAWRITNQLFDLDENMLIQQISILDRDVSNENLLFTNLGSGILPPVMRIAALIQNKKAAVVIKAFNEM